MITLCNRSDAPLVFYSAVRSRLLCAMEWGQYCDRLVMMVDGQRVKRIELSPRETMYWIHLKEENNQ